MSEFIQCNDGAVTETNNGIYLRCRYTDGATLLTQQQLDDVYATPELTVEIASGISLVLFTVALVSWGLKQALNVFKFS